MTDEVQSAVDVSEEEAAFNLSIGDEVPEANPSATEQPAVPEQEQSEPEVTQEVEVDEAEKVQLEIKKLLDDLPNNQAATQKQIEKIHGKLGELNRTLSQMQTGGKLKVNASKLTRIAENFDSDFAQSLAEDLSEALEGAGNGSGVDVDTLKEALRTEMATEFDKKMQVSLLKIQHRDYAEIYGSDEFAQWKQTLPADELNELETTWDAAFISDKLTEFKQHKATQNNTTERNNERLARAITPSGTKSVQKVIATEEDGFNSVFEKT
jgi:hypothetical protein